jgi:hypothetical protein
LFWKSSNQTTAGGAGGPNNLAGCYNRRMRPVSLCLASVVIACCAPLDAASYVYNNGPADFINGFEDGLRVLADDFTVTAPTRLTSLRFWAIEQSQSSYNGSISWWIYTNKNGIPGVQVPGFAGNSAAAGTYLGLGPNPLAPYRYVYDLRLETPSALPPGTYWLVLHNGPLSDDSFTGFSWAITAPNSTLISQQSTIVDGAFGSNSGWETNGVQLAFELYGVEGSDRTE